MNTENIIQSYTGSDWYETKDGAAISPLIDRYFPSGFLNDYWYYAVDLTDAPITFHILTGLCVLSMAINRRVWLPFGDTKIYANIYGLILAESSFFHKTTAIDIALGVLKKYSPDVCMPRTFSEEALYKKLSEMEKNAIGILAYGEFKTLLMLLQKNYNQGLTSFLTEECFKCEDLVTRELVGSAKSKETKKFVIQNLFISILGGTTPDWFLNSVNKADFTGGFLARFLVLREKEKQRTCPFPCKVDESRKDGLVAALVGLEMLSGEMTLSEEANARYDEWYKKIDGKVAKIEKHQDILSAFYARHGNYVLKMAMLYAISVDRSLVISGEAIEKAIDLIEFFLKYVEDFVNDELRLTEEAQNKDIIIRALKSWHNRKGYSMPMDKSQLMRNSHLDSKEFHEALNALVDEDRIKPIGQIAGRHNSFLQVRLNAVQNISGKWEERPHER